MEKPSLALLLIEGVRCRERFCHWGVALELVGERGFAEKAADVFLVVPEIEDVVAAKAGEWGGGWGLRWTLRASLSNCRTSAGQPRGLWRCGHFRIFTSPLARGLFHLFEPDVLSRDR